MPVSLSRPLWAISFEASLFLFCLNKTPIFFTSSLGGRGWHSGSFLQQTGCHCEDAAGLTWLSGVIGAFLIAVSATADTDYSIVPGCCQCVSWWLYQFTSKSTTLSVRARNNWCFHSSNKSILKEKEPGYYCSAIDSHILQVYNLALQPCGLHVQLSQSCMPLMQL